MLRRIMTAMAATLSLAITGDVSDHNSTNQIPPLVGEAGTASTSGSYNGDYEAWRAFDHSGATMWLSEVWKSPAWIAYDFGSRRFIDRYTISHNNGSLTSRAPKDFELQASNDGTIWITVDRRTDQTGWRSGSVRSYRVEHPGHYARYRLFITDDNDAREGIVVVSISALTLETCFCDRPRLDTTPSVIADTPVSSLIGDTPVHSASEDVGGRNEALEAGEDSSSSDWVLTDWEIPEWIVHDFGIDHRIIRSSIPRRDPAIDFASSTFLLQGSYDGSAWTTLAFRTIENDWRSEYPRGYNVRNPSRFRLFRLQLTAASDEPLGSALLPLVQSELEGC